jgi:hypothetical protein
MAEQPVSQSDTLSLDSLTLALVVSGLGVCTDEAVADLRRYIESNAITHTSVEFDESLERAKRYFAQGDAHFFLCDGEPCQQRRRFEATSNALQYEAERNRLSDFINGLPRALQASAGGVAACGPRM